MSETAGLSIRWYVVQTQPNAERKALANLERQGFQTYLPRYRKRRRHARRVETVIAPLFPRYLFIAVDTATQRWRAIHSTIGVSRLVCNGYEPAAVPTRVIEQLRAQHDVAGLIKVDMAPRFVRGDKIRVLDGLFSACLGWLEGVTDGQRVSILLDLLGRKVRVAIDAENVVAA